jgi:hypothetical protein
VLPVLRRIIRESVSEFQRQSVLEGKGTLEIIIHWYSKTLNYMALPVMDGVSDLNRKKVIISYLEIVQRELKVLSHRVDTTLASLRNNY